MSNRRVAIALFLVFGAVAYKSGLCITIDNQLQVIRNDCYERLAIGQRLDEKDVYRKTDSKTIAECQMECTHDEERCRSFSFGVGIKGNASCELSSYVIKETVDLKPIGTVDDTDFDLYIKKLGCKLVIDMQPNLPEYADDEPYVPSEPNKPKHRPRPNFYKKHHNPFQYGSEHQSSYNSESHWTVNKVYKGDKLLDNGDRAVSYNEPAGNQNKPNNYDFINSKPNEYINSDQFSISNPYDDYESAISHKPQGYDNTHDSNRKPSYSSNKNPISSSYNDKPFSPPNGPSAYGADHSPNKPLDSTYNLNQKPPFRPTHLNNPYNADSSDYKPNRPQYQDPDNPNYESYKPLGPSYNDNSNGYTNNKPHNTPSSENSEGYHYNKPSSSNSGHNESPYGGGDFNGYHYQKPMGPSYENAIKPVFETGNEYEYPKRPSFLGESYETDNQRKPNIPSRLYDNNYHGIPEMYSPKYPYQRPVIEDTIDPYGHLVTSVITEIGNVCFRRALAAKRVSRVFVRKAVSCERVEHCQDECAEEKRFICEGFNYRIDPSGHGRGDCELLDVPYVRLDLGEDVIPDPDYDYYEKDRNCKEQRPEYGPPGGDRLPRPPPPSSSHGWYSNERHYDSRDRFGNKYDSHVNIDHIDSDYDSRPPLRRPYNRRSDYHEEFHSSRNKYEDHYSSYDYGYRYSIPFSSSGKDYDYKSYEPYLPPRNRFDYTNSGFQTKYYVKPYDDRPIERPSYNKWGVYGGSYGNFGRDYIDYSLYDDKSYDLTKKKYDFVPAGVPKHWGEYGGTYGTGGYTYNYQTNNDWGVNAINEHKYQGFNSNNYGLHPPFNKPSVGYLPSPDNEYTGYKYERPGGLVTGDSSYPKEPQLTFVNECSLRSATGYRLYKSVVKKILTTPTIYDCEYACFKEKDFICTSYAFRYVVGAGIPPNNCYLSDKNYKKLDYYTDLEQDRNFDIYTMNNRERCDGGTPHHRDSSECFLHVRSGQRFDERCAKDSFIVKSIVDCELACLKSVRFICRAFSFRYGSPLIGGIAENCQLTDIPYHELDFRRDLIFDPGFVIYERASFGYGCEINQLPALPKPKPGSVSLGDEICYIGYGWPAKLLPQATKRILRVNSESECKAECTRARMETPFCCMTFSYKSIGVKDEPNCFLSDIFQRDLLENIDYIRDPDYWIFSWDNTKSECQFPDYYEQRVPFDQRYDVSPGSWTWRIYSVGGWPCKRGSLCKQSELGFWFCELEGGSPSAWDYCCRPSHPCGYSEAFPYQWCYVGPSSTQWRKCNDRYYPYLPSVYPSDHYVPIHTAKPSVIPIHTSSIPSKLPTFDYVTKPPGYIPTTYVPSPPTSHIEPPKRTYLPPSINQPRPWITTGKPLQTNLQPPFRTGFRPDRPAASPPPYKPTPTLNEYEDQFDNFFLDPPKPGGFGQARYWPVSYLHKEMPPNMTASFEQNFDRMKMRDPIDSKPKSEAIQNVIEEIANISNKADDILHVQIPLSNKFTTNIDDTKKSNKLISKAIDLLPLPVETINITKMERIISDDINPNTAQNNAKDKYNIGRSAPFYRRGFIEKANVTNYGRSPRFL